MSRLLKKYSYQYQYLKLQKEDTEEEFDLLQVEWKKIFGKYFSQIKNEVWINEETGEVRTEPPGEEENTKPEKPEKLKKLYRKISTKAHPDKGGSDEEFSNIKECYEKNDILGLLNYASENDIKFDIDDDDEALFKKSIKTLENDIKKMELSLIWSFFKGNDAIKMRVIKQLEIEHKIEIDPKYIMDQLES